MFSKNTESFYIDHPKVTLQKESRVRIKSSTQQISSCECTCDMDIVLVTCIIMYISQDENLSFP